MLADWSTSDGSRASLNGLEIPHSSLINEKEIFTRPDLINPQMCTFIKFGQSKISDVLCRSSPNYYTNSIILQLEKKQECKRNFVYHIQLLPRSKRNFRQRVNNDRFYVIHINMHQGASNSDILKAYYFSRLLDKAMQEKTESETVNGYKIEDAIRAAEWHFS